MTKKQIASAGHAAMVQKAFQNTANRANMDKLRNDRAGMKTHFDQIDKLMLLDQQRRTEPLKAAVNEIINLSSKAKGRCR